MCKSMAEGGQRCAAHTKARLERAAESMRNAADNADDERFGGIERFYEARQKWEDAAVEYASTPTGHEAFTERKTQAERDGDVQTAAMLDNILRRGEVMRIANEQTRAALLLGSFTEKGLPETSLSEVIAPDENNNALDEADQQAWLALIDSATAASDGQRRAATYGQVDTAIASAATTDAGLASALHGMTSWMERNEHFRVPESYSRYDDYDGRGDWQAEQLARTHFGAMQAQMRRALRHPNAGSNTFRTVAPFLPPRETLMNPKLPAEELAGFSGAAAQSGLDAQDWATLRKRRDETWETKVWFAKNDPDEYAREDARQSLIGIQWDGMSPSEMSRLRNDLPAIFDADQQALIEQSMMTWVRHFGTDEHRERVQTRDERLAAVAAVQAQHDRARLEAADKPKVSLLRRSR